MKKLFAMATALSMTLALVACAPSSFSIITDDQGVHVVAENGSDESGTGEITVEEGYGLCVNHIVNKGSFHVTATDESGNVVFDKDITDSIMDTVPVTGDFDISVTAKGADGTVDVIAYDVEAQAMADATLPQALEDAGVDGATADAVNPWSEAADPAAAADGAGVGYFNLPEDGLELKDGGPVNWDHYQYMTLLAEARGYAGAAELNVRKGVNNPAEPVSYDTKDPSGDYNEYAYSWDVQAADWTVKCFGNEKGRTMKALWTSDNFSYSMTVRGQGDIVDTYGLTDGDVVTLVDAIG